MATKYKHIHRFKHTYIHNWPLQLFSQDYGLDSYTTHVVCINFIPEWRDLQFNVDSERQIFGETLSWQVYLLSEFLPEICWEQIAEEIIFFHTSFWCMTWGTNPVIASNKPTHYILDYGNFIVLDNLQIPSFRIFHSVIHCHIVICAFFKFIYSGNY